MSQDQNDQAEVILKRRPITFDHEATFYVPVFQKDFEEDGSLTGYPCFTYSMADASSDEQMAASMNPDYILELKGRFKATTKPVVEFKGE